MELLVNKRILQANDDIASENRRLLQQHGVTTINLVSSPGSGKTTLLERTAMDPRRNFSLAVVEGDIATSLDADRIARLGVPVVQINTQGSCHLDARMVSEALRQIDLRDLQLLFLENVGNLVCPAEFDLGEDYKVALLSVTEGDDKPAKYPAMFQRASAVLFTKTDLLGMTDFNLDLATSRALAANPLLQVLSLSCRTGQGMEGWLNWLNHAIDRPKAIPNQH